MTPIELRPQTGGSPIVGTWNAQGLLYLMGQGGTLKWSADTIDGAMPLAVAFKSDSVAVIAPVHPMCHLEDEQRRLRLGLETFDIHMTVPKWRRPIKMAAIASVVFASFVCGWWIHFLATTASPAVVQSQEEIYVF